MANQYFNFYYDPARQGYDTSSWRTLFGNVPQVGSNRLMVFPQSAIIHYGDILRGDAVFSLNIAAPAVGADAKFGFLHFSKNAYAYFKIINGVLSAETSDGTTTNSSAITWQSGWTSTNTEFRIKWEAGTATFFIGGVQQAIIQDISISGDPMSLYVSNNGTSTVLLNYINVKTIQSYLLNEALDDSSFEPVVVEADRINITEAVTMSIDNPGVDKSDSLTITESVTGTIDNPGVNLSDSLDITESSTVDAPA